MQLLFMNSRQVKLKRNFRTRVREQRADLFVEFELQLVINYDFTSACLRLGQMIKVFAEIKEIHLPVIN